MTRTSTIIPRLLLLILASIAIGEQTGFSQPASPALGSAAHGSLLDARKNFVTKTVRNPRQDRATVIIDLDPTTRKLKITHPNEER